MKVIRSNKLKLFVEDKLSKTIYQNGVTFFDTAEVYGRYTNDDLVGEALQPFREKVKIATKFSFELEDLKGGLNSRLQKIKKVVEASLKRLRTDHIDLYHQLNSALSPLAAPTSLQP